MLRDAALVLDILLERTVGLQTIEALLTVVLQEEVEVHPAVHLPEVVALGKRK